MSKAHTAGNSCKMKSEGQAEDAALGRAGKGPGKYFKQNQVCNPNTLIPIALPVA